MSQDQTIRTTVVILLCFILDARPLFSQIITNPGGKPDAYELIRGFGTDWASSFYIFDFCEDEAAARATRQLAEAQFDACEYSEDFRAQWNALKIGLESEYESIKRKWIDRNGPLPPVSQRKMLTPVFSSGPNNSCVETLAFAKRTPAWSEVERFKQGEPLETVLGFDPKRQCIRYPDGRPW